MGTSSVKPIGLKVRAACLFESKGPYTSAATMSELKPYSHPACLDDEALLAQCDLTTGRTGGPGGQNRNKVETLVELTHRASGVIGQASERRSQAENKRVALRRLRLELAVRVRLAVPLGEVGSALWKSRRREPPRNATAGSPPKDRWSAGGQGTLELNPDHADFPAILAEALDVLAAADFDPKPASLRLNCSASQLVKLIRAHGPALQYVNAERLSRNQHTLK